MRTLIKTSISGLLFAALGFGQMPGFFGSNASGGGGGISVVSHTSAGSTNGSSVTAPSSGGLNITGANLLLIACATYSANCPTPTLSPSVCTLSPLNIYVVGSRFQWFYCYGPTGTSSLTASVSGAANPSLGIIAYSTTSGSSVDQQNGGGIGSGTSFTPGSVTPLHPNELVVSGTAFSLAITGLSITGGFTILDQVAQSAGNCEGLVTAYLVQTTATAANPTLNWTNSAGTGGANATFQ